VPAFDLFLVIPKRAELTSEVVPLIRPFKDTKYSNAH
jgi:hypothetical protein